MSVKPAIDANDGKPWSDTDVEDLKAALVSGSTIEEAALHLCRSGTISDVMDKAKEFGLPFESRPLPTPVPTRKITKAEVVSLGEDHYGVAFEYDDGHKETIEAATREAAELAAKDRVGELVPILSR
jgi:hypothetical protein